MEPAVTDSPAGEIAIPDLPGRGCEVRTDLVERLERFSNSRALADCVQGGSFLRKKPLGICGFGVQQLENRCNGAQGDHPRLRVGAVRRSIIAPSSGGPSRSGGQRWP